MVDTVSQLSEVKIPQASPVQLALDVEFLASDELEGRDTPSQGIEKAALYLEERFTKIGIASYYKNYRDKFQVNGKNAYNIVAMSPGTDQELKDEVVVIGAHYDHIGLLTAVAGDSIANGANDNATGTATVLSIAQTLKMLDFNRRTVVFALFSAEEKGLLGSKNLANRMKKDGVNVVAMLNFEMTGVPMKNRDYITYLTGYDTSNMASVFNEANKSRMATGKLDQAAQFNLFKRSDNYPFYQEFNVPSQTFCTFDFTNFDHYHKVGDDISHIDAVHMAQVVDALMPGIFKVINEEQLKLLKTKDE
jgi:Zn-dependent M28 family amino/carboxypeptidase